MRLIDADALIQDMIDKKIPFNASFDNEPIGIIPFNVATHSFGFWDEGFDDVGIVVSCNWFGIEPIAWMPLPEPYTETKEETND